MTRSLLALSLALPMLAAPALAQPRGRQWFTYDEAFGGTSRFGGQAGLRPLPQVTGWLDAEHWLEVRDGKVWKVRAADGTAMLHQDPATLSQIAPTGIANNPVAARTEDDAFRIYVVNGDLWAVDVTAKTSRRLRLTPLPPPPS